MPIGSKTNAVFFPFNYVPKRVSLLADFFDQKIITKWSPSGLGKSVIQHFKYGPTTASLTKHSQRDETSPASFEKTLSALSNKIKNAVAKLDTLRQRSWRFNALWILYTSFAYLLYAIILALVVGWENWGLVETSVLTGGPLLSGSKQYL